ncbi:uncharacterized protein LOC125544898 [Triticum urartu]|uniref:uncharacterized protein LOC125544898 n=1 Tax=Triticum urartu TaxID=4572 RepID=UPI002044BD60|nr:uncharacterized protein LOC125544898 [Triticum urartu]
MDADETIRFQRAFAMLYVSSFVGPRDHPKQATHSACQMVLEHADLIDLNWGKYTLEEILVGATKNRGRLNLKTAWVYGCPLVLMVVFFDSIEIGFIKLDQKVEPRIKYYNASLLEALVHYNCSKVDGVTTYGVLKPKIKDRDFDDDEGEDSIKALTRKAIPWFTSHVERMAVEGTGCSMDLHAMLEAASGAQSRDIDLIKERYLLNEKTTVVEDIRKLFDYIMSIRNETKSNNIRYLLACGKNSIQDLKKEKMNITREICSSKNTSVTECATSVKDTRMEGKAIDGTEIVGAYIPDLNIPTYEEGEFVGHNND